MSSKGVIAIDDPLCGYHFCDPWDVTISNRLGVRYFLTPYQLDRPDWQLLGYANQFSLYESRYSPTLVHVDNDEKSPHKMLFLRSFYLDGNDFVIVIPTAAAGRRVHVTLTARSGFIVYVDGKQHPFGADEYNLLFVDTKPGDKLIRISYNPVRSFFKGLPSASTGQGRQ